MERDAVADSQLPTSQRRPSSSGPRPAMSSFTLGQLVATARTTASKRLGAAPDDPYRRRAGLATHRGLFARFGRARSRRARCASVRRPRLGRDVRSARRVPPSSARHGDPHESLQPGRCDRRSGSRASRRRTDRERNPPPSERPCRRAPEPPGASGHQAAREIAERHPCCRGDRGEPARGRRADRSPAASTEGESSAPRSARPPAIPPRGGRAGPPVRADETRRAGGRRVLRASLELRTPGERPRSRSRRRRMSFVRRTS